MKKLVFIFLTCILTQSALAALTVVDRNKLASVTLHTELIESSKRVYLAADFEANHAAGLIGCQLTVEHKNGKTSGPTYRLEEVTSLLPKERIPLNLGLFPERFHASGLDVKAELVCQRVTFFDRQANKPKTTLLKGSTTPGEVCCRQSSIKIICAHPGGDGSIDVARATQLTPTLRDPNNYEPCWPE